MNLRELLAIPQHLGSEDYVLKLSQAIRQPQKTVENYVVTKQLAGCFDEALTLVRDAFGESKAAYLHGSFGAGKSHFMALLYLLLQGDPHARSIPELAPVVDKHADWTQGRKFLLVTYHLSGATTLESALLGGYVDRIKELHPEAPPPPVYRSAGLIEDARRYRSRFGDAQFFALLNEGLESTGWGSLSNWEGPGFDYAANASPKDPEHERLISDLCRNVFTGSRETVGYIDLDEGLSLVSKHARSLGYDAVILFLDEVMLWLATRSADEAAKEGPKLAKLVESQKSDRPAPLVSFLARQRALKELLGQGRLGADQAKVEEVLEWWNQRFRTITLEDRNLPEIVGRRLLKRKDTTAERLIEAEFEKALRIPGNVLETMMTRTGDREQFRKLYPFTPAFMEVLVGAASALQRQRTGLRILAQILDEQADRMQLGEIFPVGELFRVMEKGSDPMLEEMRVLFEYARALWKRFRAQIEHDAEASFEDFDTLPPAKQQRLRSEARIAGTLILAALVPNLESFRDLNGTRLAALNYGSIKTKLPGTEGQQVLTTCRRWATNGLVQLSDPGSSTPTISVHLTSVDVNAVIESARRVHETERNIATKAADLLFEELNVKPDGNFWADYSFTWRGTKRAAEIACFNLLEASTDKFKPSQDDGWLLVIDTPIYKTGDGPKNHVHKLREIDRRHPDGVNTLVWIPSGLTERASKDLGRLTVIDYLLSPIADRIREHAPQLNAVEREQARSDLGAMQRQLTIEVKKAIADVYGVGTPVPGNVDAGLQLTPPEQFASLARDFKPRRPDSGKLGDALAHLMAQALDWQYPKHPDFKSDEVSLSRKLYEKAYEYLLEALRDGDRRKSLPEKRERLQLRGLLEPLQLAQVSDQFLHATDDHWRIFFERAHHDGGGGVLTVGKMRGYLEAERMGLDSDLEDLVILFYAARTNRSFRSQWGAVEAKIGSLKNDWQLQEEQLPGSEAWRTAVKRAATIFGTTESSTAVNAAALAKFFTDIKTKASELLKGSEDLVAALPDRDSERYRTAVTARDLLRQLAGAQNGLHMVGTLENAPTSTSDNVLARSIKTAAEVTAALKTKGNLMLDPLRAVTVEPYASAARTILDEVDAALRMNELSVAEGLSGVLDKSSLNGSRLLREFAAAQNSAAVKPPPVSSTSQEKPSVQTKRVIASGSVAAPSDELEAIFSQIRSKLPPNGHTEVVLSWEIVSKE